MSLRHSPKSYPIGTSSIQLKVPLAIGTLQWGTTVIDDTLINHKGVIAEDTCREIVQILQDHDVQLYDTAEGYGGGTSEKRLGRICQATTTHNAIFITKFLPAPWRGTRKDLERAVVASCTRLQVSSIPIYLLHSPVHWRPIEHWVEACAMCHKKGLIGSMGLSNCNAEQVERAVAAGKKFGIPVVCNQVHYSLLCYNSAALQKMQDTCKRLNVAIVGFSPIGQGLLVDGLNREKWSTIKPVRMLRLQWDEVQPIRQVLSELSRKYEKSMAQIALNWCICHNVIPLVGCRSSRQARDSVGALGWRLNSKDVEALDRVALSRSTLESPSWRRMIFVTLFGVVMVVCRTLDAIGFGAVAAAKVTKA